MRKIRNVETVLYLFPNLADKIIFIDDTLLFALRSLQDLPFGSLNSKYAAQFLRNFTQI